MPRLTGGDFDRLFSTFTSSAFRLEGLDAYAVPDEVEPLRAFLAGEPAGSAWYSGWLDQIRSITNAGKKFVRVRLISDPPSDYLRFSLYCTQFNQAAGEDIRFLNKTKAQVELGLPSYDFWLFDDARVVRMYFADDGQFEGAEILTEPTIVEQHRQWQAISLQHAVPYDHYVQAHMDRAS